MRIRNVFCALALLCGAFTLSGMLTGCGGATAVSSTATAHNVYVVQQAGTGNGNPTASSILEFSSASMGSVTTTVTLNPPAGMTIYSVAVDASGNVYLGGNTGTSPHGGEVAIYAASATGTATPTRVITGASTLLNYPLGLAVDASGNVYVADNFIGTSPYGGGVAVFSATASGNVAPTKTITGSNTGFVTVNGLAVDTSGNIYVAQIGGSSPSVEVFSATASGNVAPTRNILGSNTTLSIPYAVAVDASNNVYVANIGLASTTGVAVFSSTATGNVAPVRVIEGSNTALSTPQGIAVDSSGNIDVEDVTGTNVLGNSPSIKVFSSVAAGNVAPARIFSSTQWTGGSSVIATF